MSNTKSDTDSTQCALNFGQLDACELLIKAGADPYVEDFSHMWDAQTKEPAYYHMHTYH